MTQESMRACRIEQVGKQRNGQPRYWCSAHKASATGQHGIRLDECELAYRSATHNDVFDLDVEQWPGGVALWGAVPPVFDTTSFKPEIGIHVHARRVAGPKKDVDRTFDAVRIKNPRKNLFDESESIISSETAVNYYLSRFLDHKIRHLFCIRCGELHLDAGYFAIKPHRTHLCHGCGHLFRDDAKSVSNPIALLRERRDFPQAPHVSRRADRKLDIKQSDCCGGIQIWASNPAFLWTAERQEEEGLHVHAYDGAGNELYNDTYCEVTIDDTLLSEEHIRHFMTQRTLPFLKDRIKSVKCPTCGASNFMRGEEALALHSQHQCGLCGTLFKSPGKMRLIVTNPFLEVRDKLLNENSLNRRDI